MLEQGGAHADDAASLNNSHGGLPSASSTSSTELNHQVEAFRGLLSLHWLSSHDTVSVEELMLNVIFFVFLISSNFKPWWPGSPQPRA